MVDTNVLVSAVIAGGPPARVVARAAAGCVRLVLCEPVLVELRRVLQEKLGFDAGQIDVYLLYLEAIADEVVADPLDVRPVSGDADDDVVLAAAVAARADLIVSGDRRHVLPLGSVQGIPIVTAQALLARLARLVAMEPASPGSRFLAAHGRLAGSIEIADDFELSDSEIDAMLDAPQ